MMLLLLYDDNTSWQGYAPDLRHRALFLLCLRMATWLNRNDFQLVALTVMESLQVKGETWKSCRFRWIMLLLLYDDNTSWQGYAPDLRHGALLLFCLQMAMWLKRNDFVPRLTHWWKDFNSTLTVRVRLEQLPTSGDWWYFFRMMMALCQTAIPSLRG